ncbi:MAG TPA: sialate O-acetylesterase, partial [Flavisolibacter sp.]|nr:sialate O-acetylesterase [Flavisolibacter sp.]
VRLPAIIGNHMVLLRNSTIKIWGWADPYERVTVKPDWDTSTYSAIGSSGATFEINIKTGADGNKHSIIIKGHNTILIEDVVFGEVWICSGQSNMEMNMNWGMPMYAADAEKATNDKMRFFYIPKKTSLFPQDDVTAQWVVCTPAEMKNFSVVGYFFGDRLQTNLHTAIGLINSNWGGTPAEVWTPSYLIEQDTALRKMTTELKPNAGWPVIPGATYNAMINPVTKFNISGAIWYQGEANVGTWYGYTHLLNAMITSWRTEWKKDLPFYFVQIAPFAGYGKGNAAALLREAQTKAAASVSNTGMVVVSDLVDNINDIHPKLKKPVGLRLADYALVKTYGFNLQSYRSPNYDHMKIEKNKIQIFFDQVPTTLKSTDKSITGFFIAGEDKNFVPADAKIEGKSVIVWSKDVKQPIAVRFGFTNDSMPNLFTSEGLPVNLFRTDNWDAISTVNK